MIWTRVTVNANAGVGFYQKRALAKQVLPDTITAVQRDNVRSSHMVAAKEMEIISSMKTPVMTNVERFVRLNLKQEWVRHP